MLLFGLAVLASVASCALAARGQGSSAQSRQDSSGNNGYEDLALWIDKEQVKMFSGMSIKIDVIANGNVQPYILEPMFEQHLPEIPSEVSYVNFTWVSGMKKYYYHFDRLHSSDESILEPPVISIKTKGRVPRKAKEFSVLLPCSGNRSGIAKFSIGLLIQTRRGRPVPGTPLRLQLRKECSQRGAYPTGSRALARAPGPDPECNRKCANQGWCNSEKICQCPEGYMGQHCQIALCYPQCMNGGNCSAPGLCSCPPGYQGRHCEGGICTEKCLNGGKCIQKDKCECSKGYHGLRCEFSKCVIPCLNGGKCRDVNKCRCLPGYSGDHCQIKSWRVQSRSACQRCGHGTCQPDNTCKCDKGYFGRLCNHKAITNRKRGPSKLPRR
ncbi:protein shifted-like isoform X2 [Ctenocephalides felis]|uniref:protein shifted-like isoform X2 n=1 Tax=Ctenocephalides felis TaxID=7515 RepID=UPI000E6E3A0F|nr:protein shifted-like isoform X2 [Ctenocephalides felis]